MGFVKSLYHPLHIKYGINMDKQLIQSNINLDRIVYLTFNPKVVGISDGSSPVPPRVAANSAPLPPLEHQFAPPLDEPTSVLAKGIQRRK